MKPIIDLTGKKFSKLTVLERVRGKDNKRVYWKCKCDCGNTVIIQSGHLRYGHTKSCGCEQFKKGEKNGNWKGGKVKSKRGYIEILLDENDKFYPMANYKGYVLEHRLVMAKKLKRLLGKFEFVHHKNRKKDDNRTENLELVNGHTHALITKLEQEVERLKKEMDKLNNKGLPKN